MDAFKRHELTKNQGNKPSPLQQGDQNATDGYKNITWKQCIKLDLNLMVLSSKEL